MNRDRPSIDIIWQFKQRYFCVLRIKHRELQKKEIMIKENLTERRKSGHAMMLSCSFMLTVYESCKYIIVYHCVCISLLSCYHTLNATFHVFNRCRLMGFVCAILPVASSPVCCALFQMLRLKDISIH